MSEAQSKRCSACDELIPATPQFFHRNSESADGLLGQCKACCQVKRKLRKERGGSLRDYIPEGMKRCPSCQQLLAATPEFFCRNRTTKGGLCSLCKACHSAKKKAYYSQPAAREHKRVWNNEYRHRPDVRERNALRAYRKRCENTPVKEYQPPSCTNIHQVIYLTAPQREMDTERYEQFYYLISHQFAGSEVLESRELFPSAKSLSAAWSDVLHRIDTLIFITDHDPAIEHKLWNEVCTAHNAGKSVFLSRIEKDETLGLIPYTPQNNHVLNMAHKR